MFDSPPHLQQTCCDCCPCRAPRYRISRRYVRCINPYYTDPTLPRRARPVFNGRYYSRLCSISQGRKTCCFCEHRYLPFFPCLLPAETMNSCRSRLCTTARSPTWSGRSLLELQNCCSWHPRIVSVSSLSSSMLANCACYGRSQITSALGFTG